MQALTIPKVNSRGQPGVVSTCSPYATGLITSDPVLPSEGCIPIGVACKRALSEKSAGVGYGGVSICTKLDSSIANR